MVVEFARMNSYQVLEETEKAVSDHLLCAISTFKVLIMLGGLHCYV